MSVVAVEAGQLSLVLDVHRVMGWETTLRRSRREKGRRRLYMARRKNKIQVCKCIVSYLWMHQSLPVVNYSPCCNSDSHDLALRGAAAQGVIPHSLPYMLHHTCVGTAGDDPRTCIQHNMCPKYTIWTEICPHAHKLDFNVSFQNYGY